MAIQKWLFLELFSYIYFHKKQPVQLKMHSSLHATFDSRDVGNNFQMRNFKEEKAELIFRVKEEMTNHNDQESGTLKTLYDYLQSINSEKQLDGFLSRTVVEYLDYKIEVGSKLIEFENYFSNPINSLISTDLKRLGKYLIKKKTKITYWGKAWSENHSDWIYFDKVLDLKKLRTKLNFGENIIEHQNLDNKSRLEKGFIDEKTGEGIMGKLK